MSAEFAWLIEFTDNLAPEYWAAQDGGGWSTPDADEAVRFARREDAQRVIDGLRIRDAIATEHGWAPMPTDATPDHGSTDQRSTAHG